jgi:iron complex outermembrane receptor protein
MIAKTLFSLFFHWLTIFPIFVLTVENSNNDCKIVLSGRALSDKNEPLAFAHVHMVVPHLHTTADAEGFFKFENLCAGNYCLKISAVGYETKLFDFRLEESQKMSFTLHEDVMGVREVIVKAERYDDEKNKSRTAKVISADEISKNAGVTLAESLSKTAGVSFISTGAGIAKPVIRGMSLSRVSVLENGVKQEEQQWGADHSLQIDAQNIHDAEILKGSAALRYGGDAVGGVVNLLPAPVPQKFSVKSSTSFHSVNELYAQSVAVENRLGAYFVRTRFSCQSFADTKVPATEFNYNRYILPIVDNRLKNTAGRDANALINFGKQSTNTRSEFLLSYSHQKAGIFAGAMGIPRAYQLSPDGDWRNTDLPRQNNGHFKAVWNYKRFFTPEMSFELDLGYQDNLRREESAPHAHGQGSIPTDNTALRLHLRTFSADLALTNDRKNHSENIGLQIQLQDNKVSGFEFLIPDYQSFKAGFFAILSRRLSDKVSLDGGARADIFALQSKGYTQNFYDESGKITQKFVRAEDLQKFFFNFSFSGGISWDFAEKMQMKVQISHSERMPNIAELASNGVHHGTFRHELGDQNMRSERGWQLNTEVIYSGKNWQFDLSPFAYYFDNYIYLRPSGRFSTLPEAGQVFQYVQAPVYMLGSEANFRYSVTSFLQSRTSFEYVRNENLQTQIPLPFTPPMSLKEELILTVAKKWVLNAGFSHFSAQKRTDRNERATAAYRLFDAGLSYSVEGKFVKCDFSFLAKNITNEIYINHMSRYKILNLPEAGRNFVLQARFVL